MSDQDQAVAIHNAARQDANAAHGGNRQDLVWDTKLANDAAQWAQHLAAIDSLDHSSDESRPGEGENLSSYSGTNATASLAIGAQQWANEKSSYSGETIGQGDFEAWGHYTQIIWPSTTSFGMAVAEAASKNFYVVGRYSPAGNVNGQSAWGNAPAAPAPSTPSSDGDGVYLVNSANGNQSSSGFAWYPHISRANDGQQPSAYIDIKKDGNVTWEGNTLEGTFADGNVFVCSVNADAASQAFGTAVGTAHNNFRSFTIHKDDDRVVYEINGWQVRSIYWCA